MASVYGLMEGRLRGAGYPTAHAKAILAVAKASRSCAAARKWWTGEASLRSEQAIEALWLNVRRLAALYAVQFMPAEGV